MREQDISGGNQTRGVWFVYFLILILIVFQINLLLFFETHKELSVFTPVSHFTPFDGFSCLSDGILLIEMRFFVNCNKKLMEQRIKHYMP